MHNEEREICSSNEQQKPYQDFPAWLDNLFFRFALIYKGLWTQHMKSDAEILATQIEWYFPLQAFNGGIVSKAIEYCKMNYDEPPSIKQFVAVCRQERDRYNFHNPQLTHDYKESTPMSPLLHEYMMRNPRIEDDPFKLIFQKYKGKERGQEVIKEIKRQLSAKKSKQ